MWGIDPKYCWGLDDLDRVFIISLPCIIAAKPGANRGAGLQARLLPHNPCET